MLVVPCMSQALIRLSDNFCDPPTHPKTKIGVGGGLGRS